MKPHLTTSARPATRSSAGSVSSGSRSQSTPAGGWNAPTRFLPAAMLTPVLPPTAASTMPSSEVETGTQRTPRSQLAATKPARSVTAPPPTPTTTSVRVKPAAAQLVPAARGDLDGLARLGVRHLDEQRLAAPGRRSARRCPPAAGRTARRSARRRRSAPGRAPARSRPTRTSYGRSPGTGMRVVTVRTLSVRRCRPATRTCGAQAAAPARRGAGAADRPSVGQLSQTCTAGLLDDQAVRDRRDGRRRAPRCRPGSGSAG